MSRAEEAAAVQLFFGLIGKPQAVRDGRSKLEAEFGRAALVSKAWPFSWTEYYREEFGEGLVRQFVVQDGTIRPEELVEIKLATNRLEAELAQGGKRRLNLDPGYLNDAKLVLATTKDYAHRLYLGQGIYGEVTLSYRAGEYRPLDHTYPDYRSEEYRAFFLHAREVFLAARGGSAEETRR